MPKARKEYECFECKKTIIIGEEYERKARYNNPDDRKYGGNEKSIQKCICKECISENKYSYIDEKFNNIEKDKSVIKFGVHYGQKWKHLADDYIIFIYSKIKDGKYRQEIENELNRRLNLKKTCEIKPLNFDERNQKIMDLREKYIKNETAIYKSLSIHMETYYNKIIEAGSVSYRKRKSNDYEAWYLDNNTQKDWDWVETKTIIALYERGLLKPIEFTDNILDFRPTKYIAIKRDITPKVSNRLTKRKIIEWAKNNNFGIRELIVWKRTWIESNIVKHGYEFTFQTSLKSLPQCGYSIYCYGTLNDINKYNSLELVKRIKDDIYKIELESNDYAYNKACEIFKDKYSITDISKGYGLMGRKTTPFYEENIKEFINKKHDLTRLKIGLEN